MAGARSSVNTYQVEGLREIQRELARLQDRETARAVRGVNKSLAQQVVDLAQPPTKSGALGQSMKAQGGMRDAVAQAGGTARVPYAAVVHWGWPKRNIRRNAFLYRALAQARQNDGFEDEYLHALDQVLTAALGRR